MPPLITIGLPVHNGMPYLPEAMDSLLCQSERGFELLVIDDGSTDDSLAYIRAVHDCRVRVITQKQRGLSATLNRMLAEVNTPWLMRHDADDIAYPQRLQQTVEYIRRYPQAGMFYALADYNLAGRRWGKFRTTQATSEELRRITQSGYLLSVCHPTATLNVQKTIEVGGYRFDLYVEDIDLWWRMALTYDIEFIPEITVGVRHNAGSGSAQHFKSQVLNTLYVQYLLISHLTQREPRGYESVKGVLADMVHMPTLKFREEMRGANASAATGAYRYAICHLGRAFVESPKAFVTRALYEVYPKRTVHLGADPEILKMANKLWGSPETQKEPCASEAGSSNAI